MTYNEISDELDKELQEVLKPIYQKYVKLMREIGCNESHVIGIIMFNIDHVFKEDE